jgi:hypothetical protein
MTCKCGHGQEEHDPIEGEPELGGACAVCDCEEYDEGVVLEDEA